jgi:hypothetical protein
MLQRTIEWIVVKAACSPALGRDNAGSKSPFWEYASDVRSPARTGRAPRLGPLMVQKGVLKHPLAMRNNLLGFCRQRTIGKNGLAESFQRSLLIGRQIPALAADLGVAGG